MFFGPIGKQHWLAETFFFSSETAARPHRPIYQVCVFWVDRKTRWPPASAWLRHFRLLWKRWTEFNESWQEARSQCHLGSLCFRTNRRKKKQDGRPGIWLVDTFLTSRLTPLNGIQRNLIGSKTLTSFTKFVFFGPIGKEDDHLASDSPRHSFLLFLWNCCKTTTSYTKLSSTKFVFSDRSEKKKQDGRPGIWWAEIFSTSLKTLNGIHRNLTGRKISTSSTKVVFFGQSEKTKMATPASDWLRQFRHLLWKHRTEFNETWKEARSQRPLPSLCFSGRSEKQDVCPDLCLAETFSTSLWGTCKLRNGKKRKETKRIGKKKNEKKTRRKETKKNETQKNENKIVRKETKQKKKKRKEKNVKKRNEMKSTETRR